MRLIIIGSGNVATHLSMAILKAGHSIAGVCGRNFEHTAELAKRLNTKSFDNISTIPTDADIYLISVSDDNISDVASQMPNVKGIVAHTAGSVPISVLQRFVSHGVVYPLQSFSKNRTIDVAQVPFCIEGCDSETTDSLMAFARSLSSNVRTMSTAQRARLHLAAVFASNFANSMYAEAETILKESNIPLDVMRQLILETAAKAADMGPIAAQTGPARRNDIGVMNHQMEMLPDSELQKLYSFVSERIRGRYKPSNS